MCFMIRVERQHAVSASNLFKYCQPCHGLILFKHHHPLQFSLPQLSDLLLAAEEWFARASAAEPLARHPFFLWNCGARAGASQFHGHAQVALSQVCPVPSERQQVLLACRDMPPHKHNTWQEMQLFSAWKMTADPVGSRMQWVGRKVHCEAGSGAEHLLTASRLS